MNANAKSLEAILAEAEAALRSGRQPPLPLLFSRLNLNRIPRKFRQPIANIAWRSGFTAFGLRVLHRVVHPENPKASSPATAAEVAEYANLLLRAGAIHEARRMLESIKTEEHPAALLFRAFSHFARWEHELAIPILRTYSQIIENPYQRLVGRVNLAAALAAVEEKSEVIDLLALNISEAEAGGHRRLAGNCYEIRSQVHIQRRDFNAARKDLESSWQLLKIAGSSDQFFVEKWTALLDGLEGGRLDPILAFREHARQRDEFESVREADRFHLMVKFDQEIFERLVFGTPVGAYRERLAKAYDFAHLPSSYTWGGSSGRVFDLKTARFIDQEGGEGPIAPGRKIHQLLEVLLRDFYRPARIGALFAEVFPNEYFDVYTSSNRVHVLLFHLRSWIQSQGLPLEIAPTRVGYQLRHLAGETPFGIRIELERKSPSPELLLWEDVVRAVGSSSFTAREACAKSSVSRTSMQRLLRWALENGRVETYKQGKQVWYEVSSPAASLKKSA